MLWLLACATEEPIPTSADEGLLVTDLQSYEALTEAVPTLRDGAHGLIKLLAEHEVRGSHDDEAVSGSYVTKGTASLVVHGGDWYAVTARHVVLPNAKTEVLTLPSEEEGEFDEVFFDRVDGLGTEVAIGSLGVHATSFAFSQTADVAVLAIAEGDRNAVLAAMEPFANKPLRLAGGEATAGAEVEAWGFPARTHPQVERVAISSVREGFFIVNRPLEPGFSGGPVLLSSGKAVGGIITRSDVDAGQSTVLVWPSLPLESAVHIESPGEGEFLGLAVTLR